MASLPLSLCIIYIHDGQRAPDRRCPSGRRRPRRSAILESSSRGDRQPLFSHWTYGLVVGLGEGNKLQKGKARRQRWPEAGGGETPALHECAGNEQIKRSVGATIQLDSQPASQSGRPALNIYVCKSRDRTTRVRPRLGKSGSKGQATPMRTRRKL